MRNTKRIADLLTVGRAVIALIFVWIGFSRGNQVLELVAWLLIASWTSDVLDGTLARNSQVQYRSWVGDHDLEFDMAVAFGTLIYLVASGFMNHWAGIFYILSWTAIFWEIGLQSALGKLFQAPIYGWFIVVTVREATSTGLWMIAWIAIAVLTTWPRFPNEVIPTFLSGMKRMTPR